LHSKSDQRNLQAKSSNIIKYSNEGASRNAFEVAKHKEKVQARKITARLSCLYTLSLSTPAGYQEQSN